MTRELEEQAYNLERISNEGDHSKIDRLKMKQAVKSIRRAIRLINDVFPEEI